METRKRVVLAGSNSRVPQDLFTRFLEKFPDSYLDHHADFKKFSALLGKENRLTKCADETLLILNVEKPAHFLPETFTALKSSSLKNIPIVVLLADENKQTIQECYRNHVAGVIVVSDAENNYAQTVASIFDFWLNICRLPKNPVEDSDVTAIKNSLDEHFFSLKRN